MEASPVARVLARPWPSSGGFSINADAAKAASWSASPTSRCRSFRPLSAPPVLPDARLFPKLDLGLRPPPRDLLGARHRRWCSGVLPLRWHRNSNSVSQASSAERWPGRRERHSKPAQAGALHDTCDALWPYVFIAVAGWLATDIWRWLGVLAGNTDRRELETMNWVRAVATALVAARDRQADGLPDRRAG